MPINGDSIYCDCCGSEKLAEVVGGNLVIRDRRHGEKHLAVIPVQALVDKLADQGYIIDNHFEKGAAAARTAASEKTTAAPVV